MWAIKDGQVIRCKTDRDKCTVHCNTSQKVHVFVRYSVEILWEILFYEIYAYDHTYMSNLCQNWVTVFKWDLWPYRGQVHQSVWNPKESSGQKQSQGVAQNLSQPSLSSKKTTHSPGAHTLIARPPTPPASLPDSGDSANKYPRALINCLDSSSRWVTGRGVRRFWFPYNLQERLRDDSSARPWESQWPHKGIYSSIPRTVSPSQIDFGFPATLNSTET